MELNGLQFVAHGVITDSESGLTDTIDMEADIDLAQIVASPDQELTDDGNLYPKIDIAEVAFTLHPDKFHFKSSGELPLYKTHNFEKSLQKWLSS